MHNKPSKRLQKALAISVFLHAFCWFLLNAKPFISPQEEEKPIEVSFIDEKETGAPLENLQVVEQSNQALNNEKPEEAQFLGKNNQRVAKETKAQNQGEFSNKVGGGIGLDKQVQNENKKQNKPSIKHKGTLPTLADLKPKFDWDQVKSDGMKGSSQGVARTADYLKDVETGAQTILNTREFVYYSYYSRIKGKLQKLWGPKLKEKMQKFLQSGRSLASTPVDRTTQLVITLDSDGILKGVKVIGESGIVELDEAAIDAFRAAAPFPNPPQGIIEKDGTVKIRWDFVLEA